MKIIKVIYDSNSTFILDIVNSFNKSAIIELLNVDSRNDKKSVMGLQSRFGTKKVPLLVFCNENLEEVDAIWSENNPDWKLDIKNKLKKLYAI